VGLTSDVLIVGGGIFGLSAALELRQRGHTVTLIDPGPIPHPLAASTDISKVVRMEYGADALYMELGERSREGWLRWDAEWGGALYHDDGVTMLARSPMQPGGYEYESYHLLRSRGHSPERLNSAEIARRFPAWNSHQYVDGFFHAAGGWVESGKAILRLVEQLRSAGVSIHAGQAASRLIEDSGRVIGVETAQGERFEAGQVLIAAGQWTPVLLPEMASVMRTPGMPVFHLRPADPGLFADPSFTVFTADISTTGWYGFPLHPADGVVKLGHHGAGVMVHPVRDERVVTDQEIALLRDFLKESLPALADAPIVYTRRCLYCDTPDGNFWIDRVPNRPGLTVTAGGSGHGLKFGPLLGGIIADVVEGKDNPFRARFAWRDVDWGGALADAARMLESG
jgi:glycine/D-amino acid oxidase-like deaminating enzyme